MALLEIQDLKKSFPLPGGSSRAVLDVPAFRLEAGEEVALAGESGSGKTTFLHLIAGILRPDSGVIRLAGTDLAGLSEARRDRLRAENIGYVFQGSYLLPGFSALENVLLGMAFGPGARPAEARARLERLGLGARLHDRPARLSFGQRQRVALARALSSGPRLVLADEPTGSLDAARAAEALGLLRETCREEGAALLLVSHDPAILEAFARRESLRDLNRAAAPSSEQESA